MHNTHFSYTHAQKIFKNVLPLLLFLRKTKDQILREAR